MADTIKPEIKVDPAGASPSKLHDIEAYEDDDELLIPPKFDPDASDPGPQAWLVKIPSYLWEAWAKQYAEIDEDEEIEIGRLKVWRNDDPRKERSQITLNNGNEYAYDLPTTYNLDTKQGYNNVIVFTEKDMPHRAGARRNQKLSSRGIPLKAERYGQFQSRRPGGYRTAIPKQTALAPMITHIADATPVQDQSYYDHFGKQWAASQEPKIKTKIHEGLDRSMHPGKRTALSSIGAFGLSSRPSGTRKKVPKDKAVRMQEIELIDELYKCFRTYKYWSLKALQQQTRQPVTYIKQTVEKIADLVRSGRFSMNYVLKPEFMMNVKEEDVKEDIAMVKVEEEGAEDSEMGTGVEGEEEEEEEEDDDEEFADDAFEDVGMEGFGD